MINFLWTYVNGPVARIRLVTIVEAVKALIGLNTVEVGLSFLDGEDVYGLVSFDILCD